MITIVAYLDTLPRPTPPEVRERKSAERNVQRLTSLLITGGHTPNGAAICLPVEAWPGIVHALGAMPEADWATVRQLGNRAVPGLQEALKATIEPAPVVEPEPDVTPTPKPRTSRAKG